MRFPDWAPRLRAAIAAEREAPFIWGQRDCCLAIANLLKAESDVQLATPFEPTADGPRYGEPKGAAVALRRYLKAQKIPTRHMTFAELLSATVASRAEACRLPEVPWRYAQRGDLVLALAPTEEGLQPVLALVDLSGQSLISTYMDAGWIALPMHAAQRAWRV